MEDAAGRAEDATAFGVRFRSTRLAERLARIVDTVARRGGRAFLVGGCVRDAQLGGAATDADVEVFGLSPAALIESVREHGPAEVVGRGFPVLRVAGLAIDVSLPRRGPARREIDFAAGADPQMPLAESLARRDFRINAMAWDVHAGQLEDPHDGRGDLARRRLRHTSERFGEDPVRVLRGMQLIARFDLRAAPETVAVSRGLGFEGLPAERIRGEWRRLLLDGIEVGRGLAFLRETGWVEAFPELAALVGCEQDPEWHPEGDVWVHTGHCLDAFAADRLGEPDEDWIVGLAVLCHDLGKPETTRLREGRVTSHGHEARGAPLTQRFVRRFAPEPNLLAALEPLVVHHLAPAQLYRERERVGDAAIRRLARRVGRIDRLVRVARADHAGRPPRPVDFPAGDWLLERAAALDVDAGPPERLVRGRDLLFLGLRGPLLGRWLQACYEAQLAGDFATTADGVAWVRERVDGDPPEAAPERL